MEWRNSTIADNGIVFWLDDKPEVLITWKHTASGTYYLLALLSDLGSVPEEFRSLSSAKQFAEELFA